MDLLVVGLVVDPTAKDDANPFESESADGGRVLEARARIWGIVVSKWISELRCAASSFRNAFHGLDAGHRDLEMDFMV